MLPGTKQMQGEYLVRPYGPSDDSAVRHLYTRMGSPYRPVPRTPPRCRPCTSERTGAGFGRPLVTPADR